MQRFAGKVALVNGAGGIGGATATRLASEGAAVMVLDIDLGAAETTVREITGSGGIAQAVWGDLGDETSMREAVERTVSEFGGVDVMANIGFVGGGSMPQDLDVVSTPPEVWDRILGVNLLGYVRACRLAIPHMIERGGGAIVNVSSGTAIVAEKIRMAYATSKVAVIGITRNVAIQFASEGIRANCLVPGTIATPNAMRRRDPALAEATVAGVPLGRMGRPEEMAAVIAFLLSDDAAYVTGQSLVADGGYSASAYH
jgi:NAD(P)-dependent dehydrogenase (short-subunit alcohol dehydrogenase family)